MKREGRKMTGKRITVRKGELSSREGGGEGGGGEEKIGSRRHVIKIQQVGMLQKGGRKRGIKAWRDVRERSEGEGKGRGVAVVWLRVELEKKGSMKECHKRNRGKKEGKGSHEKETNTM